MLDDVPFSRIQKHRIIINDCIITLREPIYLLNPKVWLSPLPCGAMMRKKHHQWPSWIVLQAAWVASIRGLHSFLICGWSFDCQRQAISVT